MADKGLAHGRVLEHFLFTLLVGISLSLRPGLKRGRMDTAGNDVSGRSLPAPPMQQDQSHDLSSPGTVETKHQGL